MHSRASTDAHTTYTHTHIFLHKNTTHHYTQINHPAYSATSARAHLLHNRHIVVHRYSLTICIHLRSKTMNHAELHESMSRIRPAFRMTEEVEMRMQDILDDPSPVDPGVPNFGSDSTLQQTV